MKLECKLPLPKTTAAPSWADPRLAMVIGAIRQQVVTVPATEVVQAVPEDPKRIAVGFKVRTIPSGSVMLGPLGTSQVYGTQITSTTGITWYDLFTYGPLVCGGWELSPFAGAEFAVPVLVWEWYRQL